MKARTALVTGGAGFIGSHIVEALLRREVQVWVVDDLSTGSESNLKGALEGGANFLKADIRRIREAKGLPSSFDVVFHEAAIASVPKSIDDPMLVHDVNVNAALEVMNLCVERGVKRFIFASSAAVYGAVASPPAKEEDYCAPGSPYGASKLSVENYMHAYRSAYGLETVALRYFNVYGPRQRSDDDYSGVIPLFARQLLTGVTPKIFGDGLQTRDFVYVGDVAEANMLAMDTAEASGQVFNIASGSNVTILDLLEVMAEVTGSGPVRPAFGPPRQGDARVGSSSIERARRLLHYSPRVGLDEGLGNVVKYLGLKLGVPAR
ncbi:MAG: NAD-dependent epimerase/dehydratase family protein [Thaumarchaeota archaeon]|nr:NAD-dependent epimerase/dehydratase family protein [Nitrososphaerota archaeon]